MDEPQIVSLVHQARVGTDVLSIRSVPAGVWNNEVAEVRTTAGTFYAKEYHQLVDISGYLPPEVSPETRLSLSVYVQALAYRSLCDGYRLVPAVLAVGTTAYLMQSIDGTHPLLADLSSGNCPESVYTCLASGLARFHNAGTELPTRSSPLSDTRFRDYKLELQYGAAHSIGGIAASRVESLIDHYRKYGRCTVHGDLNSKNILISSSGRAHVIDFEQAHYGSPAFDLADFLSEVFIAGVNFRENPGLRLAGRAFITSYLKASTVPDLGKLLEEAALHLAAQVLYRFSGPSHDIWTHYVAPSRREEAAERAAVLLSGPRRKLSSVFEEI